MTKDIETGASIEIRDATSADAEVIGQFGAALMSLHHELDSSRFMESSSRTPEMYAAYLKSQTEKSSSLVLVAEKDDVVVGYVFARIEGPDYMVFRGPAGVIHDLFVAPTHRGNGAGRALLTKALSWLKSNGSPQVVLSTAYGNLAAQRLFQSAGFRYTMVEMTCEFPDP